MADFYNAGCVHVGYKTGLIGQSREEFEQSIKIEKPDYKIAPGITGYCIFCQTDHFEMENNCTECGEHVEQQ